MIGDDTNEPNEVLTAAAVIARLNNDVWKYKDVIDEQKEKLEKLREDAREWEQIVSNKDKEIERLKLTLAEEKELRIAWRKRAFDDDGWSFSGKVEHLSYVNDHLRNQMEKAVGTLNAALKFDPDDEIEE